MRQPTLSTTILIVVALAVSDAGSTYSLPRRNHLDHILVTLAESAVQGHQPGAMSSRQGSQVGIGDIGMTGDIGEHRPCKGLGIRPEHVSARLSQRLEQLESLGCGRPETDHRPQQSALRDRCRHVGTGMVPQPGCGRLMVDMPGQADRDQHVAVQQNCHSSSLASLTSSVVMMRPRSSTFNPVVGSTVIRSAEAGPVGSTARVTRSAITRLTEVPRSAAMCRTRRRVSSGRSTVVRMGTRIPVRSIIDALHQ
jgi:hypothetical protein